MKALIVTGGTTHQKFAEEWIQKERYDLLIAADSGMNFYYQAKLLPDLIVGDFDSAKPEVLAFYEQNPAVEVCRLNPIKDDTDTEHAIREAIRRGASEITIFGATGTRLDHVMGNLTLLGIGLEEGVEISLMDPYNKIRMIRESLTIRKDQQFGSFISLLPYAGDVEGVTLTGMKYPLKDYTMGGFNSLGVSNEILAEEAVIQMKKGFLLVIESRDRF